MPIAILVLLSFLYTQNIALRATNHGADKLTKAAVEQEVKADLAKFHPSTEFIYNGRK